ncbi:hypothetical protein ABK040_013862 [Willaertia magna]
MSHQQELNLPPPNVPKSCKSIPVEHLNDSSIFILQNYINGEFQSNDNCDEFIINKEPATNKILSYIPSAKEKVIQQAVDACKKCWKERSWRGLSEEERANYLDKIANKIEHDKQMWAEMEARDTGKPISTALQVDIPRAIANFRFFANAIRQSSTKAHLMSNKVVNYTSRRPSGIVGIIVPWNLPIYLLSWKVAPALACGNCVIAKPSELSPMTANLLAKTIHEIGLPKGAFNLVHGYGKDCGRAIVDHEAIKTITFTGGTATGRVVGELSAKHYKKVSLELGGKNPMVVFDDCDFEKAVETAKRAAFSNQGQICLCCSRILVQESIYEKFITKLKQLVEETTFIGNPLDVKTNFGSQISHEHLQKIEYYVELAKQEGGTILCGGKRPELKDELIKDGCFYQPTIITGLKPNSRCSLEEIFGPVIVVHPFKTEDEALEMANLVSYGLSASVFTNNLSRAHRFSDELECGMVWVNTWLLRDLRTPFGGVKDSGVGREGGEYSLEFYSEDKNICIQL